MKTGFTRRFVVLIAMMLVLGFCGCEDTTTETTVDVTGNWSYSDSAGLQSTLVLVQTDESVSGASTDAATISGVASGDMIALNLSYSDGSSTVLDGTVSTNLMSGTFSSSTSSNGIWSAVRRD